MPTIEVSHLKKVYGSGAASTIALLDVSFTVAAGEFVTITGSSGSGESTLLHLFGFLGRPADGDDRF